MAVNLRRQANESFASKTAATFVYHRHIWASNTIVFHSLSHWQMSLIALTRLGIVAYDNFGLTEQRKLLLMGYD